MNTIKGNKQQRYCLCGYTIWVQYNVAEEVSDTVFWNQENSGSSINKCPVCRKKLDIDNLS